MTKNMARVFLALLLAYASPCLAQSVTSVSNSDGTLTISPTTGAVVASLAAAPTASTSMTAPFFNATTAGTGYKLGGTPVLFFPNGNTISIAVGGSALASITSGTGNMAVGAAALEFDTSGTDNTALGYTALQHLTSSNGNLAIGVSAMQGSTGAPLTTGGGNTAIGNSALIDIQSTATDNVGIGASAAESLTTGNYNVAIGTTALNDDTTGSDSTAIGIFALYSATGSPNTATGYYAGAYISTGTDNVAIGDNAMVSTSANSVTGSYNIAIGDYALAAITGAATSNVAVGYDALTSNTSGNYNTAVGYEALGDNNTGSDSAAFGYEALYSATSSPNTALGYEAGFSITTGTDNTLVGVEAGKDITTGSDNIILGEGGTGNAITTGSGNILIGNNLSGFSSSVSNLIDIGGVIVITTGSPPTADIYANLVAEDTLNAGGLVYAPYLGSGNGNFVCWNTIGGEVLQQSSPCNQSQRKLKENFVGVSDATALSDLMALKPTQFNFKATTPANPDPNATGTQYGLIAEEVAAVDPKLTVYENDMKTPKSWRQDSVIALLVKATQEQMKTVQKQQKEIDDLKAELKTLREQQAK